jgi:hypothetical protein
MFDIDAPLFQQKSFNLGVRARQLMYRNRTSEPYISGDSIAKACDFELYKNRKNSKKEIVDAKSIFCSSEKLEQMLDEFGDVINAKVLVLGNSDRDFFEVRSSFPESVKVVYLQNSHISDGFFQTLPIGIENLRHGRNGLLNLFRNPVPNRKVAEKILVGPFSPTHSERMELISWRQIKDERLHFQSEFLTPKTLADLAYSFKYIACPRGNGTDTHRFWEALYRGSIPVVKKSRWAQSIAELGFPVVQLSSWNFSEFCEKSKDLVGYSFDPKSIPFLWMGYWREAIRLNSQ